MLEGHQLAVTSVAFSHDGSRLVSGPADRTVRTWNMETQHVSEDLSHLMDDYTRRIWDTVQVTTMIEPHTEPDLDQMFCLAFSLNGSCIISASYGTVLLWRTSTRETACMLRGYSYLVNCVTFYPCGRHLVLGLLNHIVSIWSAITGEESVLKGHPCQVQSAAFSP